MDSCESHRETVAFTLSGKGRPSRILKTVKVTLFSGWLSVGPVPTLTSRAEIFLSSSYLAIIS